MRFDTAYPHLAEHVLNRGGRLYVNASRHSYEEGWLITFNSAGIRGRQCSPFSPAPLVVKASCEDDVDYSIQTALRDLEACLAWMEAHGPTEIVLVAPDSEYFQEASCSRPTVDTCRGGTSPFVALCGGCMEAEKVVDIPCSKTYLEHDLAGTFPQLAALPLLRRAAMSQEEATRILNQSLFGATAAARNAAEGLMRAGPEVPSQSRGFVVGGSMPDDPFAVLIGGGEVVWHCEEDRLDSVQAGLEALEAQISTM